MRAELMRGWREEVSHATSTEGSDSVCWLNMAPNDRHGTKRRNHSTGYDLDGPGASGKRRQTYIRDRRRMRYTRFRANSATPMEGTVNRRGVNSAMAHELGRFVT